jgi:hypothetical protein
VPLASGPSAALTKLPEMQIYSGNNLPLSEDVHAPKPTTNAWHIDGKSANSKGVFTIEVESKVPLASGPSAA